METVYFTCLNNDCEKHRNVFVEGDPDHAHCERERLYLEGQQRRTIPWGLLIAATAALGLGAAAFMLYRRAASSRASSSGSSNLRDARATQAWSGDYAQTDERRGHAVPPPIA